jgi:hypothetical protein
MSNVLIFTGAGISKPLGLPLTNDFVDRIKAVCNGIVLQTLKELRPSANHTDIEVVLSFLVLHLEITTSIV